MSKLGFARKIIDGGAKDPDYIYNNDNSWAIKVRDTRVDFGSIVWQEGANKIANMVFFSESGSYICIINKGGSRPNDQIAAWIFIPKDTLTTGAELLEVIDGAKKNIFEQKIDEAELSELFSREYEDKKVAVEYTASRGKEYAFRYYGEGCDYLLQELLDCLYQPYYSDYKAVFFLDKASVTSCTGTDLTQKPLQKIMSLLPPSQNEDGFVPYIGFSKFENPKNVSKGEKIDIIWKRDGYEEVKKSITISSDNQQVEQISGNDYKKIIKPSYFSVVDDSGNKLYSCSIKIDEVLLGADGRSYPESLLKGVKVTISKEGYETHSKKYDLSDLSPKITLKKESYNISYKIPLKNDSYSYLTTVVGVELKTGSTESPIKGYTVDGIPRQDGKNKIYTLKYDIPKYDTSKPRTIGSDGNKKQESVKPFPVWAILLTTLIVGMVIGGGIGMLLYPKSVDKHLTENENENEDRTMIVDTPVSEVDYMNANDKWDQTSLNNYIPELYEALIEYDLNSIEEKLKGKVIDGQQDSNLSKLLAAVKLAKEGDWEAARESIGQYSQSLIAFNDYLNCLEMIRNKVVLNYLIKNKIWDKTSLDKYDPNLYDYLNNYKFDKIKKSLNGRDNSGYIFKLLNAIDKDKGKGKDKASAIPPYNKNVNAINVEDYIKKILTKEPKKTEEINEQTDPRYK